MLAYLIQRALSFLLSSSKNISIRKKIFNCEFIFSQCSQSVHENYEEVVSILECRILINITAIISPSHLQTKSLFL